MFESLEYPVMEDVRSAADLDAELAALLADHWAQWTAEDAACLAAAAAAGPSDDHAAVTDVVDALEGQIHRMRCLLAAAHADLAEAQAVAAAAERVAATRGERLHRRMEAAWSARAEAIVEARAAQNAAEEARAQLGAALLDLAWARADANVAEPGDHDPDEVTRRLHDAAPGPALAAALAAALGHPTTSTDPTTAAGLLGVLSPDALVEVTAAATRVMNWAAAAQLAGAAAYAERVAMSPLGGDLWTGDTDGDAVVVAELALACTMSRYAMGHTLTTAQLLPLRFPLLHQLMLEGRLEPAKARLVVDKTLTQSDQVIAAVHHGVTPLITSVTKPQLADLIDDLIAHADPAAHAARAAQARTERRVAYRSAGDGMGVMSLYAAAEDIAAVRSVVAAATLAARRAQPGHPRTPQLDDPDQRQTPDPDGRRPAATRADTLIDLILRDSDPTPTSNEAGIGTGSRTTTADVTVLIPFSVLFDDDNTPCDLSGYGPIPAALARDLATNGTWRCAAVDDRPGSPTHATILGLGRTAHSVGYVPPAAAKAFVQLRDRHCTFPGCRQPAVRCDLDHRIPWNPDDPDGGDTCDCNLHPLCRHHHQLKQRGFTPERTENGTRWTTPTGRIYLTPHPRPPGTCQ